MKKNTSSILQIIFQSEQYYPPPISASQRGRVSFESLCCKMCLSEYLMFDNDNIIGFHKKLI